MSSTLLLGLGLIFFSMVAQPFVSAEELDQPNSRILGRARKLQQQIRNAVTLGNADSFLRGTAMVPGKQNRRSWETCRLEVVGGRSTDGYGSWPICINHVPSNATVYSFGIGGDVSFDSAMIKRGAKVYGFDPTIDPGYVRETFLRDFPEQYSGFTFTQVGLAATNGIISFLSPRAGTGSLTAVKSDALYDTLTGRYVDSGSRAATLTLQTIMTALKHDKIDVLKIDVEGIEYDICKTEEFLKTLDKVGQVLFEFHERFFKLPGRSTKNAECIKQLEKRGFRDVYNKRGEEHVLARVSPQAKIGFRVQ